MPKREPNSWFIHLNALGIDPKIRLCAVFLSDPTSSLIAFTKATDMKNRLGQKVSNAPEGSNAQERKTKTTESLAVTGFCLVEKNFSI